MTASVRTREEWLRLLARKAAPVLRDAAGVERDEEPVVRLACGFPASQGRRKPAPAGILPPSASADDTAELLVTPEVDDAAQVARLVLPLLLAAYTSDWRGGGLWREAVGRAALDRPDLPSWVRSVLADMPPYPHARVTVPPRRVQGTRLIRVSCPQGERGTHAAYIVRMSRSTYELAAPTCGLCGVSMLDY